MLWLANVGLSNAIMATVLAVGAWVVSRVVRRPALAHVLWALVLVKLLTPPLIEVPVYVWGLLPDRFVSYAGTIELTRSRLRAGEGSMVHNRRIEEPGGGLRAPVAIDVLASGSDANLRSRSNATSGSNLRWSRIDNGENLSGPGWNLIGGMIRALPPQVPHGTLVWGLWCAGSSIWFASQLLLGLRFVRLLRTTGEPDSQLKAEVARLARQMGLSRWPRVRMADGAFSPMLWGLGGRAIIVLPSQLIAHMPAERRATLLAHELAHYRRGDQWIRLLELVTTGIFWWHPVVWWARREIEIAEEQCCDAWVVEQCSGNPRRYAEALLDTVDYLSTGRCRTIPSVASGVGYVRLLRRRLRTILKGGLPKNLSGRGRICVASIAVVVLAIHPTWLESAPRMALQAATTKVKGSEAELERFSEPEQSSGGPVRADRFALPSGETSEHGGSASYVAAASPPLIWATAISPDGRYEITVRDGYDVQLRDIVSNTAVDFDPHRLTCVAFSPESSTFVSGGTDGAVHLCDSETGADIRLVCRLGGPVRSVAFSADGQWVAAGDRAGTVKVHDVIWPESVPLVITNEAAVRCVRFSTDGRYLAIVTDNWLSSQRGIVNVWDRRSGNHVATLNFPRAVGAIEFSGGTLLAADWTGSVIGQSIFGDRPIGQTHIPKDLVSAASFSADTRVFEAAIEALSPMNGTTAAF